MASQRKTPRSTSPAREAPGSESLGSLPLGRWNWILGGAGLVAIVLGYVLLSIPPVDGFLSLTLAPVVLVTGYCVLIPAAILAGGAHSPGRSDRGGQAHSE